mmetsp:Transcript_13088/g.45777  ORF Transcript_13088/g.45777 Transcript_13088/m.45777 type:complete len:225 (-) Transcript_13088:179-853(-)
MAVLAAAAAVAVAAWPLTRLGSHRPVVPPTSPATASTGSWARSASTWARRATRWTSRRSTRLRRSAAGRVARRTQRARARAASTDCWRTPTSSPAGRRVARSWIHPPMSCARRPRRKASATAAALVSASVLTPQQPASHLPRRVGRGSCPKRSLTRPSTKPPTAPVATTAAPACTARATILWSWAQCACRPETAAAASARRPLPPRAALSTTGEAGTTASPAPS